jgi:hypothetical protein
MKRVLVPSVLLLGVFAAALGAAGPVLGPRLLGPFLFARYKGG